ncbi:NAD-dependent epimerase/dehydratase family protein [Streptomyces sp. NBC_01288]|uniref:NAD-dependent epimerase/dehydratase family protein n=1 Tax=Streptomyces sp. NBC_01288 TaxID=2903814 RepID=UPI002E13FD1B|nr:NAD-dependent epimerase/dehydratase family protein [Streptomyces sp. NBC_01288]
MNRPRVLVTGASGFIGGAVLPLLRSTGAHVRVLAHHRSVTPGPYVEIVDGDLTDPTTLRGIGRDVDAVLHLASYIGKDEDRCAAVNVEGTRRLVEEAGRAGVAAFVQLSTAAVYGDGPFRELREGDAEPRPVSPTSRSRLRGERFVLGAGGAVLRPYLVYGTGDRWVMPGLLRVVRALRSGLPGRGGALLSLTEVGSLAASLAHMVVGTPPRRATGVFHACPSRPVSLRELVVAAHLHLGFPLVGGEQSFEGARAELVRAGCDGHLLDLFGVDHWFDATRLAELGGRVPDTGLSAGLAAHAAWYRAQLL